MALLDLSQRQNDENALVLAVPHTGRAVFLFFAAVIVAGMIVGREIHPAPVILGLLALLGGLYDESWSFDLVNRVVRHRWGLWPWYRRLEFPMDEVEEVSLIDFVKGSPPGENRGKLSKPESPAEDSVAGGAAAAAREARLGRRRPMRVQFCRLVIRTHGGEDHVVEVARNRRRDRVVEFGGAIAAVCGVPLSTDD